MVDIKAPNLLSHTTLTPSFLNLTPTTKKFLSFAQGYLMQEEHDAFSDYLVENLLFKLLGPAIAGIEDRCVLKAQAWIEQHFAMSIDINKLSQLCNLSSSQLQRRFKRSTGQGIAAYWRSKRMLKAQLLLANTQRSIENIAYEIGYENLPAFSRRFSQTFGMTPSQWREMMLTAKTMRA
ncbi:helix-turn-helix domain-containing protein [Legionella tunisiensis]|uniref:helix-turn-helix domain-containing protein n=1 Tax=Legionella tunisiensis TaxID=1034944 RepID=UPI0002E307A9|nr:AraC family transcriptional regulator [Legionella tunisiensis]